MIVDSHCHLNFNTLSSNIDEVLKNAKENNISYMQTICTKLSEFNDVKEIAYRQDNIFCSVGVHPNEVANEKLTTKEELIHLSQDKKVIGIGETGLDYFYEKSEIDLQKKSFLEHVKASRETGLPLIIHSRNADNDMANILEEEMAKGAFPALLHCFSSSKELAERALKIGVYISLSGIVTFKNATTLQKIAKTLPLDKMLVETDSPYLAPVPMRGKSNEPAYTKHVVNFASELREMTSTDFAKQTTDNFFRLFTKAVR